MTGRLVDGELVGAGAAGVCTGEDFPQFHSTARVHPLKLVGPGRIGLEGVPVFAAMPGFVNGVLATRRRPRGDPRGDRGPARAQFLKAIFQTGQQPIEVEKALNIRQGEEEQGLVVFLAAGSRQVAGVIPEFQQPAAVVQAQNAQSRRFEIELGADRGGPSQKGSGEHPQEVTVTEDDHLAFGLLQNSLEELVSTGRHGSGVLSIWTSVLPQVPAGMAILDLATGDAVVVSVVPFDQKGIQLEVRESSQARCLPRP